MPALTLNMSETPWLEHLEKVHPEQAKVAWSLMGHWNNYGKWPHRRSLINRLRRGRKTADVEFQISMLSMGWEFRDLDEVCADNETCGVPVYARQVRGERGPGSVEYGLWPQNDVLSLVNPSGWGLVLWDGSAPFIIELSDPSMALHAEAARIYQRRLAREDERGYVPAGKEFTPSRPWAYCTNIGRLIREAEVALGSSIEPPVMGRSRNTSAGIGDRVPKSFGGGFMTVEEYWENKA